MEGYVCVECAIVCYNKKRKKHLQHPLLSLLCSLRWGEQHTGVTVITGVIVFHDIDHHHSDESTAQLKK